MNKEEWQKLHGILYGCYEEFLLNYNLSKNGGNAKIRAKSERTVDISMQRAQANIENSLEAYNLLTGGEKANDTDRAYSYDDFIQPRYLAYSL